MTLRLAAARTGLSATTLRRYIKAGRLKARLMPGRYGPEYVVDEDDLRAADLLDVRRRPEPASAALAPATPVAVSPQSAPAADAVPGLLYRELLMKHEHLLVQFGMLRVSGQQLYEIRQDAERKAVEARQAALELSQIRDRHAREIGALKARLRQAELEIAARDDEIARLKNELRRAEIGLRNAAKASAIDGEFARRVVREAVAPVPLPVADDGAPLRDH